MYAYIYKLYLYTGLIVGVLPRLMQLSPNKSSPIIDKLYITGLRGKETWMYRKCEFIHFGNRFFTRKIVKLPIKKLSFYSISLLVNLLIKMIKVGDKITVFRNVKK